MKKKRFGRNQMSKRAKYANRQAAAQRRKNAGVWGTPFAKSKVA